MAANFRGLNLRRTDDRSAYVLRVEREMVKLSFSQLKRRARAIFPNQDFHTRAEAIQTIAYYRMDKRTAGFTCFT